ncbi:MAG: glycosyltransferase family 39 protein, partial [Chloroflexi bacterium]|nr:glycosyltransferase family 39 protein [Chloroflexota bacterium]
MRLAEISRNPKTWVWLAILLALVLLAAHQWHYYDALGRDAVDDAYISWRYAQNVVQGHGLVFNPGERVEGYTNFLWTIASVPILALGAGDAMGQIGMALGALCALITLLLVYAFIRQTDERPIVAGIAALLLAVDGSFALWSVSGMETAFFGLWLLAGATAYLWENRRAGRPGVLSGVFLALAAMTRPEGLLVFGLTVVHQVLVRLADLRRERSWLAAAVNWADMARILGFLALFAPYFLWRYRYYGQLLPNTFYAKVTLENTEAQNSRGWRHLETFVNVHRGWLVLLAPLAAFLRRRVSLWTTYAALVLVVYGAYIVYVGGDWSVGRFFAPILPLIYLLAAAGLVRLAELALALLRRVTADRRAVWVVGAIGVLLLTAGLFALYDASSVHGEDELFVQRFQAATATRARVAFGQWLKTHASADTYIAVDAAGQVPYFSNLRTLDMFGINDKHTAHMKVPGMGQGTPG